MKIDPKAKAFNIAYHLSRPADVQRVREIHDPARRKERAQELYDKSNAIFDKEIDLDQSASPWEAMNSRPQHHFAWVRHAFDSPTYPPTVLPVPSGAIKTSTVLKDYPAIHPARTFSQQDYFAVSKWLAQNGYAPGNLDGHFILRSDAEEASVEDLERPTPGGTEPTVFAGALVHYGVAITRTGRVYDAEELKLRIDDGPDAVASYIGIAPSTGEGGDEGATQQFIDHIVGAEDPNVKLPDGPWYEPTPGTNPQAGEKHDDSDGNVWECKQIDTGMFGRLRWHIVESEE